MPRLAPVIKTVLFATFISFSFGQPAVARLAASAGAFGRGAHLVARRRRGDAPVWRDLARARPLRTLRIGLLFLPTWSSTESRRQGRDRSAAEARKAPVYR